MGDIVAESRFRTLLLSPGIFVVLLSLCVSQALGYSKTHSYITERAAEVWPADNSHEIRKYLMPGAGDMDGDGTSKLENLLKHDRPKNDSPWTQYIGNTIVEGVVEEDAGVRSWRLPIVIPKYGGESLKEWVDHFWNPDDNTTWSSRSLFGIDCDVSSYSMNGLQLPMLAMRRVKKLKPSIIWEEWRTVCKIWLSLHMFLVIFTVPL